MRAEPVTKYRQSTVEGWRRRFLSSLAVFLLVRSSLVWSQTTDLVEISKLGQRGVGFVTPRQGAGFDVTVGMNAIGDFNGDGFDDVAFGVRDVDGSHPLVILYGRQGMTGEVALPLDGAFPGSVVLRGSNGGRYDAASVNSAGDLNGDGYADMLSGFSFYRLDPNGPSSGVGYILYGGPGIEGQGFIEEIGDTVPGVLFSSSDATYQGVGVVVAMVGDVNGDGRPDLAISAPVSTPEDRLDAVAVFVLFDVTSLPRLVDVAEVGKTIPGLVIYGRTDQEPDGKIRGASLGESLVAAGDVNGDGFADILITAGELYRRTEFLIFGGPALPPVIDLIDAENLGYVSVFTSTPAFGGEDEIAGVGDVNGDGFADLLVGATNNKKEQAFLVYGRPDFPRAVDFDNPPAGVATVIHPINDDGPHHFDEFGLVVGPAGDLNQDGLPDFLIGASSTIVRGGEAVGEAYAIFGKKDFQSDLFLGEGFAGIRLVGQGILGRFGDGLGSAGDFNGDGATDILVRNGPSGINNPTLPEVYVIYGSGSNGPPFLVNEVVPAEGSIRGGTKVVVRGSGFSGTPQVLFGGQASANVSVVSGSELRVETPPVLKPGIVDVVVTAGGATRKLIGGFEYTPRLPEIDLSDIGSRGLALPGELGDYLGLQLAFADVTGDGVDDLIVGSYADPNWIVSLVHGGADLHGSLPPFVASQSVTIVTGDVAHGYGAGVGAVGDVNGDGVADFGIGLGNATGYIVFGRTDIPQTITIEDELAAGRAVQLVRAGFRGGFSFVALRDITGDGIDDFAIGFAGPSGTGDVNPSAGEVLFLAGRRTWPTAIDLSVTDNLLARIHGVTEHQGFAGGLIAVGDVNGDGRIDLLAGSRFVPGHVFPPYDGMAYLLLSPFQLSGDISVDDLAAAGGATVMGFQLGPFLHGYDIGVAGDINKDGFADFLIGAEGGGVLDEGVVYLIYGRPDFPDVLTMLENPDQPDGIVRIHGEASERQAAQGAPAGDFNGDGYDDFLIATQPDPRPVPHLHGNVAVIFGGPSLPDRIELGHLGAGGTHITTRNISSIFMNAQTTGDLNGDGRPDFAFTENYEIDFDTQVEIAAGNVYVVYGVPSSVPFIRGDANFDGAVNISDAIFTLSYLFLGGAAPLCDDAADADDSGQIEITDAIRTLNTLFLGNASIPEPYPEAGDDPTSDLLGCRGF